ncbi:undecaprenyl-phosphate glucose phosphotransferase [Anaerolentibacter hominis]|uniref:undecaprenyl-phosphate glucose phosphotransferase n=1 Tax=Anaerolentibacter hominis TaxID=3079009 RepID=UPI0031B8B26F
MIKDHQRSLNHIHILIDAILIALAFIASYYLRFFSPLRHLRFFWIEPGTFYGLATYCKILFYLIPGYLFIYYICNLYSPKRSRRRRLIASDVLKANFLGLAYFTFVLYFMKENDFSRKFMFVFFLINCIFSYSFRASLIRILRYYRKKGYNLKHVLIVGYSRAATAYIDRVMANPEWGYYIHGILDDNQERGTEYKGIMVLGAIDNLTEILPENKLDEIVVTLGLKEYEKLEDIVKLCEKSGVHTKFVPDYGNMIPTIPYIEDLYGLPVVNIRYVPLTNMANRIIKRMMDIAGSLFAIILFSIPMLLVAIIIKLTSPGPIIFKQVRVGLHNRNFNMYKFRSMEVQDASKEKKAWTTLNDPRVTKIGKIIRKTSLDELPQFFNVLKGEMSLVGPRPERPFFVEKFKEEIPRYMIKHQVKPGITGWAQVNGYRGDTSIRKRIDCDLYYIENWTLSFDIKILFLTVFRGFVNKNAY